jgi:hypothetical protein
VEPVGHRMEKTLRSSTSQDWSKLAHVFRCFPILWHIPL